MIGKLFGFLVHPHKAWHSVADLSDSQLTPYLLYPLLLALLPTYAWYFGTTEIGWSVPGGDPLRLTNESALSIAILFYIAQVATIAVIGWFVHWMATTYGSESSTIKGIIIVGFCSTPILIAGAIGFYPILWLDMIIGVLAVSWAVYLLYIGLPITMHIPEERGFLFASAMVAVALVMVIVVMGATVILWDMGFAPSFTDNLG